MLTGYVGVCWGQATNLGVVNLQLDGCAVMLWPALGPNKFSMKDYWYEATTIAGMGSNKIVVGNVVKNVNLGSSNPDDKPDGWPWTFSTAVAVYSDQNALVRCCGVLTCWGLLHMETGEHSNYTYTRSPMLGYTHA